MGRLLEGKNAIIYGGGGGIGSGSADVAVVDALDEGAVDRHVGEVAARAGRIDVSFNLISRGDVQQIPLVEMATEAFMRYLAAEVGPYGVRVCGIWTAGVAETLSREKRVEVGGEGVPDPQAVEEMIAGMAALRRAPRLADVTEVAAFLARDSAGGMTGAMTNVTSGLVLR